MPRYSLILPALAIAAVLTAQPWQQDNSVFNPSGVPSFTFSQPRFADLDADGDQDFLLGGSNSAPVYIKNTGSASSPQFTIGENITSVIPALNAEMAVCVDIDADGDLDVVTGGFTGLHLYLNSGTPSQPLLAEQPGFFPALGLGYNPVPDLADVDGDGDPDLVVGLSEDGGVRVYTNTGTPAAAQFSAAAAQTLGDIGLYAYPVFCDLDGDGDQDILCGRDAHGFVYYQNNGNAGNPLWEANSALFTGLGNATYWNSPDLADISGDGLPDLVFGTADGPLFYYLNIGTQSSPVWQANTSLFGVVIDVGGASSPWLQDFDGDGDLDLISGSQLGYIKYHENTGTIYAPAWSENSAYFASIDHSIYAAAATGNLDADGLPDAVVGDLSGNLFFHQNTGTGFVELTGVTPPAALGGWSVPRLADMNGDLHLDLIVGNEAGNLYYYANNGTAPLPSWTAVPNYFSGLDVGSNCSPCLGDIDGDGDIDLLAGNLQGNLTCWLREGHGWTQNSSIFSGISTDQNAAPALADLDHDGDLDLILGDYDGTFSYWRNQLYSGAVLNPPQNPQHPHGGLVWDAPQGGSSSPFEAYRVYLNGELLGETTQTNWALPGLAGGQQYTAAVTARYTAGESEPATLSWTENIHNPPTGLSWHPQPEGVFLFWTAPQGSTAQLECYNIYLNSVSLGSTFIQEYDLQGLVPGQDYQVDVTAFYTDGGESEPATLSFIYTSSDDNVLPPQALRISPNPFSGSARISFSLNDGQRGSLAIYNLKGQKVRVFSELEAGPINLVWDGTDGRGRSLPPGVYLCRLSAKDGSQMLRVVLMK